MMRGENPMPSEVSAPLSGGDPESEGNASDRAEHLREMMRESERLGLYAGAAPRAEAEETA
jgi:hypothetical protein